MTTCDVVVVGAGLAGSLAAGMLGRAGYDVALVDPRPTYPPDFRCEKLDPEQFDALGRTGFRDAILPSAGRSDRLLVVRFGRVVDEMPTVQHGILYADLVNRLRAAAANHCRLVLGTAIDVETGDERQLVTLADGSRLSARLVVVATGLNFRLARALGLGREVVSPAHSLTIGFDVAPPGGGSFGPAAITYFGERPADRIAYLTLFPTARALRANLMTYWSPEDERLDAMRRDPSATLRRLLPALPAILGPFRAAGPIQARPVDLVVTQPVRRAGLVLIGDACATSCPAAGTGAAKALTDALRLCGHHVPRWFATPGMAAGKVASFAADPVKGACDAHSLALAFQLRALSTETGLPWRLRRSAKFYGRLLQGALRRSTSRISGREPEIAAGAERPGARTEPQRASLGRLLLHPLWGGASEPSADRCGDAGEVAGSSKSIDLVR